MLKPCIHRCNDSRVLTQRCCCHGSSSGEVGFLMQG